MLTESRAEMANELSREDLLNLEEYALNRQKFREKVMTHKRHRRVAIGPNLTMYFESKLTIQYQVQESGVQAARIHLPGITSPQE